MKNLVLLVVIIGVITLVIREGGRLRAQADDEPFPAHRVVDRVYYVGSKNLASYLITTDQGHILINSSFEQTVPLIRASIEKVGFRFEDVKILLTSHGHSDHVAGNALVKRLTGARVLVMEGDEDIVRSGGKGDFHYEFSVPDPLLHLSIVALNPQDGCTYYIAVC